MSTQTIGWKAPRPTSGGFPVAEGSDIPIMRPRTGRRGSDREITKLLAEALDDLSRSDCSFWACEGPSRPIGMATCVKCWAMRNIATVRATIEARSPEDKKP